MSSAGWTRSAAEPLDSDVANAEPERPARPARGFWMWAALLLVGVAVGGATIGVLLGIRQSGPLTSQGRAGGRPTILVGTVTAVASASSAPAPSRVPSAVVATGTLEATFEYVVQPGDTLRSIAQQELGDAGLWPRVYDDNRDAIGPDPDALRPGTVLRLRRAAQ